MKGHAFSISLHETVFKPHHASTKAAHLLVTFHEDCSHEQCASTLMICVEFRLPLCFWSGEYTPRERCQVRQQRKREGTPGGRARVIVKPDHYPSQSTLPYLKTRLRLRKNSNRSKKTTAKQRKRAPKNNLVGVIS